MYRKIIHHFFRPDFFYCTLLIFGFMVAVDRFAPNVDFLNPLQQALNDVDMTDVVFGNADLRETPEPDTSIVLVNFGNQSRRMIARQIEMIAAQKPKVLGIDCAFKKLKRPDEDSLLAKALSKVDNLVLYSKMLFKSEQSSHFDTIGKCHPFFARYGTTGFTNLVTPGQESYITCRSFSPKESADGVTEKAFALEIARYVDSQKVQKFLDRKNDVELINFRGNYDQFYSLDLDAFVGREDTNGFMVNPELPISLKDKIVIMGFMGENFATAGLTREDKFHTPMNPRYAGKSYPDMFGVVVHANIVSMVLHGNPLNEMPFTAELLWAAFLCYLSVVFFFYIHEEYPSWYDLVVKTTQVVAVLLILFAVVLVFARYRYKMDLTIAAIAVGLSGDLLEVYTGAMYNIVGRFTDRIKQFVQGNRKRVETQASSEGSE